MPMWERYFLYRRNIKNIDMYDKVIKLDPSLPWAYHLKGNALCHLQEFESAIHYFDKAIELSPEYAEAYYEKSRVLSLFRRKEEALEALKKAILYNEDYKKISWDDEALNNIKFSSEFKDMVPLTFSVEE